MNLYRHIETEVYLQTLGFSIYHMEKQYTTISYLSVQQSKLSPRGDEDDEMSLLHEAEGRGQQCIGSATAPRV